MLEAIFIGSIGLFVYTYFGFPMLCWLRAILFPRPIDCANIEPSVSLVVACYNEEQDLAKKIEGMLELDYPKEKLELVVASDGSTDRTNEIARSFEAQGVRFFALPRQGKAQTLNSVIPRTKGDILVFSDSNSQFEAQAIRKLVEPFNDESVGGVAGNQCYLKGVHELNATSQGEHTYWDLDRLLKLWQSQGGNTISATGAIYAIRRSLFQSIPDGVTDDFTTSTRVIAQGKRLVFAPDARCWEPVAASAQQEFGRKVRVMSRGFQSVWVMRELLNPVRHGFYAWQLFSHKVLRRLMFLPLVAILFSSILLCPNNVVLWPLVAAQVLFYAAAFGGWIAQKSAVSLPKRFFLPFFFCLVNFACMLAAYNFFTGKKIVRWQTHRAPHSDVAGAAAE